MVISKNVEWFSSWFNSPYYHLLYSNRDEVEAKLFLDKLMEYFLPEKADVFLDLACGKGRHSQYLNAKGFDVIGMDLSPESIGSAKSMENETLQFYTHDMRVPHYVNHFDYVLNLFTSFGYFDNPKDDYKVIKAIATALKTNGVLLIDYMNVKKVIANLKSNETKVIGGVSFEITRSYSSGFIVKTIQVQDKNENYQFEERVRAFTLEHFEQLLLANNLKVVNLFGSYELEDFNEQKSDRLIIVATKGT